MANIIKESLPQLLSPNAAELGRYGKNPVNYFNGLPGIVVPLTSVHAKGYELPTRPGLSRHAHTLLIRNCSLRFLRVSMKLISVSITGNMMHLKCGMSMPKTKQ